VRYLEEHPEVTSVLITGGDPLIMKTAVLRRYIEPLLKVETLQSIRLGTKAPAYWPYRFTTDSDADDLLRLFEEVEGSGKHLALMAHYTHPRELEPAVAQEALARIQRTGAVVRTQAPVMRRINDSAETWARMWRLQVQLGAVPYYMFVARDTGPRNYFEVPLVRAHEIFNRAVRTLSGLGRTVRGPSMSTTPGKITVDGVARVYGEKVLALRFLQARDPQWVGRPFFARYDESAVWYDELTPAFHEKEFFYSAELRKMLEEANPLKLASEAG
jgi:L-lysine 2,3-aminomutase